MNAQPRLFSEISPDNPDVIEVWLDGEVIMTASVAEVGCSGQEAIIRLVDILAREF